jgi:hypothetical protein
MNFQIQSFATIRICVEDVAQSRDWYKRFFAVSYLSIMKMNHWTFVALLLLPLTQASCVTPPPTGMPCADQWRPD